MRAARIGEATNPGPPARGQPKDHQSPESTEKAASSEAPHCAASLPGREPVAPPATGPRGSMHIRVLPHVRGAQALTLRVSPSTMVSEVKAAVRAASGDPSLDVGLVFTQRELQDDRPLSYYGVCDGDTLRPDPDPVDQDFLFTEISFYVATLAGTTTLHRAHLDDSITWVKEEIELDTGVAAWAQTPVLPWQAPARQQLPCGLRSRGW